MTYLPDAALDRLRVVAGQPDLSGTKYDLVEPLGAGGMATVYRAHDRELDRPVALKVVHAASDAATTARLLEEARIIAGLEHPGIVPVHDAGVLSDGRVYYAMKLVRGRRLDEVGSAGNLPDRLRLFERVCEAVAFAHAAGVIHRDLKPQNIMVGPFGEVLVMDWGIAKRHERAAAPSSPGLPPGRDTDHGTVLGTPGYMAPEQARGDIEQVDERADVYALGALLAFLLGTDAPRALVAVCRKAMAARAGERYPGAAALADDVGRFLSHRRVAAYPEGLLGAGRRLVARHRVAVVLVLAYLSVRALVFFWARR